MLLIDLEMLLIDLGIVWIFISEGVLTRLSAFFG